VIHLNNLFRDPPYIETYKTILGGKPQRLDSKFRITYGMVLNLMRKNHVNANSESSITIPKIMEYAENTMLARNIRASIASTEKNVNEKYELYSKKHASIESLRGSLGFVEADVCREYIEWTDVLMYTGKLMYTSKKTKEISRKMVALKDEHKLLLTYNEKYRQLFDLERDYEEEKVNLENLKSLMEYQIEAICEILETKCGLIYSLNESEYAITRLGNVCSNMAEIHPLIAAKVIEKTDFCANWSVEDFVVFFSCFTQIKVDKEFRRLAVPDTVSKEMRDHLKYIGDELDLMEQNEHHCGIMTEHWRYMLTFDLIEEIVGWCACETEQQCKYFIQVVLSERGISVGDFTKAVLKIATISREWRSVCELFGNLSVAETLSKVEGVILKYVTTCQSLYV
jgi:hypothetical protein